MLAKHIAAGLVGSALLATVAFAQTPTATTDRANMPPVAASDSSSFQGNWRASKVVGLSVYNENNESLGTINGFYGVGTEQQREQTFVVEADHPTVLVGKDHGPTPAELLLAALAACLTAGIGNIAAVRGVELTEVESTVEGDIDLQGILGLSDEVRNGFEQIKVSFKIRGHASDEKLREIVEQSRARSAVFDVITNGTAVRVDIDAAGTSR
jgi:uncharacterized OsmC-like protein